MFKLRGAAPRCVRNGVSICPSCVPHGNATLHVCVCGVCENCRSLTILWMNPDIQECCNVEASYILTVMFFMCLLQHCVIDLSLPNDTLIGRTEHFAVFPPYRFKCNYCSYNLVYDRTGCYCMFVFLSHCFHFLSYLLSFIQSLWKDYAAENSCVQF